MDLDMAGTVDAVDAEVIVTITVGEYVVQVEHDWTLTSAAGDTLDTATDSVDTVTAGLVGATVVSADASESGELTIVFASGGTLRVRADPSYEAWNVVGPRGFRVVCAPGGELVRWSLR